MYPTNKRKSIMTLIFAIAAIVCVCFGICQLCGGYAVGSGFASIVIGIVIALQNFDVVHVLPAM